tara:strand:+ start:884 stop:1120 length:237 start_codon:yes stop_codon:yes gene_type:complete
MTNKKVKLYDKNFTLGDLPNLRPGDIIVYPTDKGEHAFDDYLIVSDVDMGTGEIFGNLASLINSNNIVEAKDVIAACE